MYTKTCHGSKVSIKKNQKAVRESRIFYLLHVYQIVAPINFYQNFFFGGGGILFIWIKLKLCSSLDILLKYGT